ncbi:MAG: TraB/GumN family protein [Saprospiraceae bacterium]|nr:TraB/GumN family protein [Saprospiraceae bacterium]MBK7810147.1 TraB/GumN family protein [Saprospiraceae bacterium]MBK9629751.1 TraB/GumN family protein [Saprospiraceae bacterium]
MSRFNCLLLFLQFLGVSQAYAQDSLASSLLWKISGQDIAEPSYLFGTIHIIPAEDYFLPKGTVESFKNSKTLFMELDLSGAGDFENMLPIMDKIFMENDTTLADLLTPEEYMTVSEYMEQMGLPMMFFEKMKPMFLSAMASPEMNPANLQNGSVKSYEMEFAEMAKSQNKNLKGLETVEFQLSLFDQIPYATQAKLMVDAFKATDKQTGELDKLVEIYKSQNLNLLQSAIEEGDDGLRPYMAILLNNRNRSWIPVMQKNMAQGSCFFAVGAGHLGGPNGIIKLLKELNYKVEPIAQ